LLSYRQNCDSMQRVHISPALGKRRIDAVSQRIAFAASPTALSPAATGESGVDASVRVA
jgi:hypothetical protein